MLNRRLLVVVTVLILLLLATGMVFAQGVPSTPAQAQPSAQPTYRRIFDDEEFLSAEAPASWNDTNTGPWVVDGREIGVFVSAAPDLAAFEANNGPGVFVGLTHEGLPTPRITEQPEDAVVARSADAVNRGKGRFGGCKWGAKIEKYVNAYYAGAYDTATQCVRDRGRGQYAVVELMPLSQNYRLSLRIGAFSQADRAALDHILRSVQVLNPQMADLHHDE